MGCRTTLNERAAGGIVATNASWQGLTIGARRPVVTMYAGLALTVIAMVIPIADVVSLGTLADHVHAAYPRFTAAQVHSYDQVMLTYLLINGVIGIVTWLWMIRAVRKQKRWAPAVATTVFLIAFSVAFMNLVIKDSSGQTALNTLLGSVGLLPCVAGLAAVALLWMRGRGAEPK
jgi:uncharacterized membrane protein